MGVQWLEKGGRKILYVDYRGITEPEESLRVLRLAIEEERKGKDILILQNYEGTYANAEFVAEIKRLGAEVKDHLSKNAVVGITGIKKIFMAAYAQFSGEKNLRAFDTEEEALKWLLE
jgi:hypothetical protein